MRKANSWSTTFNLEWRAVPEYIFDKYGMYGTANWRLAEKTNAEVVILSDADTAFVQDIDELLLALDNPNPTIAGHNAHFPPEQGGSALPSPHSDLYWPEIFKRFDIEWPPALYRYSMDSGNQLPQTPPYFNLGFVALNRAALNLAREQVNEVHERLSSFTESFMRCQIGLTVIAQKERFRTIILGAEYNMANDSKHQLLNRIDREQFRVIHYLRTTELDRGRIYEPGYVASLPNSFESDADNVISMLLKEWHESIRAC